MQAFRVTCRLVSLDSLREGPRGAEGESPNQNKAIYTSQMALAMLIN